MDVVKEYGGWYEIYPEYGLDPSEQDALSFFEPDDYEEEEVYNVVEPPPNNGYLNADDAVKLMLEGAENLDGAGRYEGAFKELKGRLIHAMRLDDTGVYFLGWRDLLAKDEESAIFPLEAYYWWWRAGGAWVGKSYKTGGRNYINPTIFKERYSEDYPRFPDDAEHYREYMHPAGMDALKGYLESSEPLAHVDNPTPPPEHTTTFKPSDDLGREIVEALKASGISEDLARGIAKKLPKWLAKDDRLTPQKSPYRPFLLALVLASYLLEEGYRVERNTRDDVPSSHEGDMSIEVQRTNTVDVLTLKPGRPPQGDIERSNYFPKPPQRPDGDNFLEYAMLIASAGSITKKREDGQPWEQYGSVSDSDRDALRRGLRRYMNPSPQKKGKSEG